MRLKGLNTPSFLADSELPLEPVRRDEALRQVLRYFNVPLFLTTSACAESNGYFGCEGTYDEAGEMQGYGLSRPLLHLTKAIYAEESQLPGFVAWSKKSTTTIGI
jgi:hypothetical protein